MIGAGALQEMMSTLGARLAEQHPQVCELNLALIGTLGRFPAQHLECMHRGGETCRFQQRRAPA